MTEDALTLYLDILLFEYTAIKRILKNIYIYISGLSDSAHDSTSLDFALFQMPFLHPQFVGSWSILFFHLGTSCQTNGQICTLQTFHLQFKPLYLHLSAFISSLFPTYFSTLPLNISFVYSWPCHIYCIVLLLLFKALLSATALSIFSFIQSIVTCS